MKPVMEFRDVWYRYPSGKDWMLRGIDLEIGPGEWVSIVGANGSGKSTLVQLANGLLRPARGKVAVGGLETSDERNLPDVRRQVGVVFQDPDNQAVRMSVEEEVAFGLRNIGLPAEEVGERTRLALQEFGLWELRDRSPHALSGGQKQRLASCAVLAMRPRAVVFDEATSMLDPWSAQSLLEVMGGLRETGVAVIQVTQEMEEVLRADRVLVMQEGRIVGDGRPGDVLGNGELMQAAGLIVPFAARVREILKREGLPVPDDVTGPAEMAEEIWKSFLIR